MMDAGWGWPGAARKAHYFERGEFTAVCGRWLYSGPREPETQAVQSSPDDCAQCRRIVDRKAQS